MTADSEKPIQVVREELQEKTDQLKTLEHRWSILSHTITVLAGVAGAVISSSSLLKQADVTFLKSIIETDGVRAVIIAAVAAFGGALSYRAVSDKFTCTKSK